MSSVTIDQTVQEINVSVDETTNNITITVAIDTGGVSSSDHGGLSGLGDDDHSQYALADGTRGSFATTTQGTLADSSLQSGDNISELVNDAGYITGTIPTNTSDLINDGSDNTSTYVENDELGAVATSNDYGDLDNLPSIPSGTVTSVAVSGSDGIDIDSGSPITTSGTIALGIDKTTLLAHINVEDGAEVNDVDSVNGETGTVVLDEEDIVGTAIELDETDANGSNEIELDLSTFASCRINIDSLDVDIVDTTGRPSSGESFTKYYTWTTENGTEAYTEPIDWIMMGEDLDATKVNCLAVEYSNFPVEGLKIRAYNTYEP